MLQQLHGVTMYSHDEHHTSAPYCWSERGKGASATNPSTAVLVIITRPSVRQSLCQSRRVALFHVKHAFESLVPSQHAGVWGDDVIFEPDFVTETNLLPPQKNTHVTAL